MDSAAGTPGGNQDQGGSRGRLRGHAHTLTSGQLARFGMAEGATAGKVPAAAEGEAAGEPSAGGARAQVRRWEWLRGGGGAALRAAGALALGRGPGFCVALWPLTL